MALKNFTQFTPQTVLSATDYVVGYRALDEIRTDLDSLTVAISGLLIAKGFTPGGSSGSVRRISYRYTIGYASNLNAVSGTDDFSLNLSYTPGQIEVYRNGSHLAESLDFVASNSTQVTNMSTFNVGDIIEVVALSATGVTITTIASGGGSIFQSNYRYTCPSATVPIGTTTISGPDDLGNTLLYSSPTLDVYLNGSHLVNGPDYTATNGASITLLTGGLSSSDVVDVATLSAYDIVALGGVSRIVAGPGIILNPSSGLGDVTITGNTLQLTGGNITIPVGSTRTYKKFSTAFNSMSGYILEQKNTNITFVVDPEVITETEAITLNHVGGQFMTLSGTMERGFVAKATSPGTNSPVTSVAYTTGGALSATLQFDNTLTNPQPGDYINIWSVSGAEARQIVNTYANDITGNPHLYSATVPFSEYGTLGQLTSGSPVIYYRQASGTSWPSFSARIVEVGPSYGGVVKYTLGGVADTAGGTSLAGFALSATWYMDHGTPESFKGNRIASITLNNTLSSSTLTFSDAQATNTYLNEGDLILVLAQVFPVIAVGGSNTCVIQGCLRLPQTNGWDRTSFPAGGLYYLVNSRLDYYIGAHKVVARSGNSVTIEIAQNVCVDVNAAKKGSGRSLFPPPKHGISQIGLSTAGASDGVIKSIIRYSPPTAAAAQRSEFLNIYGNTFGEIKQIAFESTRPLLSGGGSALYAGLRLGSNLAETINSPGSVSLTNVAFQSFFPSAISLYNNSIINLRRVTINSAVSSSQTSDGVNAGDAYAIASFGSNVVASRLAINGGYAPVYITSKSNATLRYAYIKNVSQYCFYIDNSDATVTSGIFNNTGYATSDSTNTAANYASYTRGVLLSKSDVALESLTIIGGMNQGWLFLTQQLTSNFARCCFWEMPNPDASSYGVAFYNGGNMQNYYIYHMGNSLIDGGSINWWMDQDSNCVFGFCLSVGTAIGWWTQDGSNWVEYNSGAATYRGNVALFCETGIYASNNVSFRANFHEFRQTTFPIYYAGYLVSGVSTNTIVLGCGASTVTGVTINLAPDATGRFLGYSSSGII